MLLTRSIICAGILLGIGSGMHAQDATPETKQPARIQPEAKKALENMAAFYKKMDMATTKGSR